VPKIEVTFDIDTDGILNVTAKDTASQRSQSIRITGSTREKQRMIDQAQQYAEQDKKRREEIERINVADSICYQAERTLGDFGSKLSEDLRRRVEVAIRETREALSKRDATGITTVGSAQNRAARGRPIALCASAAIRTTTSG
jgi:molecular chaperone DnaK